MYKLYFLMLCLILLACSNETSQKSKDLSTHNDSNSGHRLVEEDKDTLARDLSVQGPSPKEVKEKVVKAKEKAQQAKKEAIEVSVFKDESCEVLISKYKKAISLLRENKNSSEGREIYNSLRNDPIMSKCRSAKVNKSIFKELDRQFHSKG